MLICIIGIDGSGKTPHAKKLVNTLKLAGSNSKYVWARWQPKLLKPIEVSFAWFIRKVAHTSPTNYNAYARQKRRVVQRQTLVFLWAYLVMLDYGIQLLFKVRLPLLLGKTVICDRYVYDTLVDFVADFKLSRDKVVQLLRMPLLKLFPKPDLIFLLDIAENTASKRKGDPTHGFLEYVTSRRNVYLETAKTIHALVLDASDFENVQQLITSAVAQVQKA